MWVGRVDWRALLDGRRLIQGWEMEAAHVCVRLLVAGPVLATAAHHGRRAPRRGAAPAYLLLP